MTDFLLVMKRYRTVVAVVFLALFPYQATGTSPAYSLSYQETAESRRAHPPPTPTITTHVLFRTIC